MYIFLKKRNPPKCLRFFLKLEANKNTFSQKNQSSIIILIMSLIVCVNCVSFFTCQPKMCKNRWNFAQTSEQPWNERKWNQNPKRKDISLGHFGQRIWKLALMVDGHYIPFRWWCGTFYVLICIFCHARKFSRILSILSDKVLWVVEISEEEENISFV